MRPDVEGIGPHGVGRLLTLALAAITMAGCAAGGTQPGAAPAAAFADDGGPPMRAGSTVKPSNAPASALRAGSPRSGANAAAAEAAGITRPPVDDDLPLYLPGTNLRGTIRAIGSSTLTNLLNTWGELFRKVHPNVTLDITGGGSGSALAPLLEGRSEIAQMSRPFSTSELAAFKARFGYEPTVVTVALDAIAIYVHKTNPLQRIDLVQLDAIYSQRARRGGRPPATWGELGTSGELAGVPIIVYGPQPQHGLYGLFRTMVMEGDDFRIGMQGEPVSSAIVQAVGTEENAIGFASQLFASRRTRQLPVARNPGEPAYAPDSKSIVAGRYPLARRLYLYVNRGPSRPLPVPVADFLRFVCSRQGQELIAQDGGIAMTAELAQRECLDRID